MLPHLKISISSNCNQQRNWDWHYQGLYRRRIFVAWSFWASDPVWFLVRSGVCRDFLWLQIWSGENLLITHFAAVAGSSGGVNRIHISSEILVQTPRVPPSPGSRARYILYNLRVWVIISSDNHNWQYMQYLQYSHILCFYLDRAAYGSLKLLSC